MTRPVRLLTIAGAMAVAVCFATLPTTSSNEAVAQGYWVGGNTRTYYYNGYGNVYRGNVYGSRSYTGYGNGPYGYGSSNPYAYPAQGGYGYGNGYGNRSSYNHYHGGTYRRVYTPGIGRVYTPFGSWGY